MLWRVWNSYLYYFSKIYMFYCIVPISYIGTVFLYLYRSLVLILFSCNEIYNSDIYCTYYSIYHYLIPDSCMLSPDTCLISLITCHLIHDCLTCDYHISRILSSYPLVYIQWPVFLILMYSSYSGNSWTCPAPAIPIIW